LAHTKSAKKSIRVIAERRAQNRSMNRAVKTELSKADKLIANGDQEAAREAVKAATIALDKAAQKGLIHDNNAARRKSRLMKRFNTAFPAQ
jgi:small subunit ribosomal protein S20